MTELVQTPGGGAPLRKDGDDVGTSAYEMIKEFASSGVMKGGLVASGFFFSSTSYSVNTLIRREPSKGPESARSKWKNRQKSN